MLKNVASIVCITGNGTADTKVLKVHETATLEIKTDMRTIVYFVMLKILKNFIKESEKFNMESHKLETPLNVTKYTNNLRLYNNFLKII